MKGFLFLFSFLFCFTTLSQSLLIENCTVIDVEKGIVVPNKNLLIENGRISKISSKKINNKNNIQVLDAAGKFVMPGMIDTHIHFFQTGSLYTRPDAIDLTETKPYEDELQFAEEMVPDSFKRYLRLGITTLMDVGGPFSNFKIRDSIANKQMSPNVYVTGPLFSPYQPEALSKIDDVPIVKITSREEADALFEKMLPFRPDFIKIWYIANSNEPAEKNFPVVQHIAQLAHSHNLKLAVHATQLNTAELAVKAGADILVHSVDDVPISEHLIQLLLENKVTYIPTLIVSKNYVKAFLSKPGNHPEDLAFANPGAYRSMTDLKKYGDKEVLPYIKQIRENEPRILGSYDKQMLLMNKNLKLLEDRGVNIAVGTDAGNIGTMHASSYIQEMEAMQTAGLTITQILKAATINAAKGFGLETELGSVSENKIADLLILSENPLDRLGNLSTIETIVKDGIVLMASELITETPEQVVQRQVNAYNARDIDAFMDTYSEAIKIYNFPNELSMNGKEAMRKQFDQMFQQVPNLYCEIKNRIVLGNKVVDREYVRFGERYSSVIAIYEITDGKISKVTFLR